MQSKKSFLFLILLLLLPFLSNAQFYKGLQMDFGKNRVQYDDFIWSYYRFDKFDIYFVPHGKNLVEFTAKHAYEKIKDIETFFSYNLDKRLIFVIYNNLSDFRQSNIGLVSTNEQNIGGVTHIMGNKIFLYYEDDHHHFENQISTAVTEMIFNEMLYGGNLKNRVASSALLNIPDWFEKGLASYLSEDWNFEIENRVKEGIMSGRYKKLNRLQGDDAKYAGHAIWKYIADMYGKAVIPNIIYLTKVYRSTDRGLSFVVGADINDIIPDWINYYQKKFEGEKSFNPIPDSLAIKDRRLRKKIPHQQIRNSPDGHYTAYVTNDMGKYKVWIYDNEKQKHVRLMKGGQRIEQITDYTYPIVAWHPTSDMLAIITEEKGHLLLSNYFVKTKKFEARSLFSDDKADARQILKFEKILDFSYSQTGLKFVMSAVLDGKTDIFVYNITANSTEQLTNDIADDMHPRFIDNDKRIVFSSNRQKDTLLKNDMKFDKLTEFYDLFVYDYQHKSKTLTRLTNTPYASETSPFGSSKNSYLYLSNENGINNRYIAKYDSTISSIDTITHYSYFSINRPLTNYKYGIEEFDFNPQNNSVNELFLTKQKYLIYQNPNALNDKGIPNELPKTSFRKFYDNYQVESIKKAEKDRKNAIIKQHRIDSLKEVRRKEIEKQKDSLKKISQTIVHPDSVLIDITNYVFEKDRIKNQYKPIEIPEIKEEKHKKDTLIFPKQQVYLNQFYIDQLVSQLDFSFLSSSYQTFTGGEVYFNPGGNALFKVGTKDLFEDYRLTGGVRLSVDLNSNEFLLSFEDLKYRWDKQYIFHRQSFTSTDTDGNNTQVSTSELFYVLRYPFNQTTSVKFTATGRLDKTLYKSESQATLEKADSYTSWGGLKAEYIFDNTVSLGLNLHSGLKYKFFGEFYNQVNKLKTDLFVLGADFRYYQKIHRNLIFASRLAGSASLGHQRLIYYLGSVDNWMNLWSTTSTFDKSVPINHSEKYAFQTLATNMRGFSQNARNGSNFAVWNNEIRFPIFNYLFNRPLSSEFLNNFQIIGFADAGSAWCGWLPTSEKNDYNYTTVSNSVVTVVIDKQRSPVIFGYGFGVRSRVLGYFMRLDWSWGIDGDVRLPKVVYLSLDMDF